MCTFLPLSLKPNMTEEECRAFVKKCVMHAMARDGSSGGCIRTVTINERGVFRDFTPSDAVPPTYGELKAPVPATAGASSGAMATA